MWGMLLSLLYLLPSLFTHSFSTPLLFAPLILFPLILYPLIASTPTGGSSGTAASTKDADRPTMTDRSLEDWG
jgi:hypothetical protein